MAKLTKKTFQGEIVQVEYKVRRKAGPIDYIQGSTTLDIECDDLYSKISYEDKNMFAYGQRVRVTIETL